jgi:hypothetical protein
VSELYDFLRKPVRTSGALVVAPESSRRNVQKEISEEIVYHVNQVTRVDISS